MFGLALAPIINQIAETIEQHRTETDDERAARLNDRADDLGVDAESLYRAEEHLRDALEDSDEDEAVETALAGLAEDLAGVAGVPIDGDQFLTATGLDYAALRALLIQTATANAAVAAPLAKLLHDLYQDAGLYDDLGYPDDLFAPEVPNPHPGVMADIERTRVPQFVDAFEADFGAIVDDVDDLGETGGGFDV